MTTSKKTPPKTSPASTPAGSAPAAEARPAADGQRIKQKRLERGWSVRHLAAHSGLAISTISKIENNKMVPTVEVFSKLLAALQTNPGDWFFEADAENAKPFVKLVRAASQVSIEHPAVHRDILLGGAEHGNIVIMRQVYRPHAPELQQMGHAGNELIYVIRGGLEISIRGRKKLVLNPGDSLHFSSSLPHRYEAAGDEECEALMVWWKQD